MRKLIYIFLSCISIATACSRIDDVSQDDESAVWTISVPANKGGVDTKALNIEGDETLVATWSRGDVIQVLQNDEFIGELYAESDGKETMFVGSVQGIFKLGEKLTLTYRNRDYSWQDGTLQYIADHCDYAVSAVHIMTMEGNSIHTTAAHFENEQAITRFTFVCGDAVLEPTNVVISAESGMLVQNYVSEWFFGDIMVDVLYPSEPIYVAIANHCQEKDTYTFTAKVGSETYVGTKRAKLDNGKFYETVVSMSRISGGVTVPVTGVSLDKSSLSLAKGLTDTLTATVSPSDATNKDVLWSSSNTSVATVSNGIVTAKSVGTATITVTTVEGGKTASCMVTVNPPELVSFTLSPSSLTMFPGEEVEVTIISNPSDAVITSYWTIDNDTPAILGNGNNLTRTVIASKPGNTQVRVVVWDGTKNTEKNLNVTVLDRTLYSVDMGNGLRWSMVNAGAHSPEERGDYFTATEAKAKFTDSDWRLPTKSEIETLIANCTFTRSGDGYIVQSKINGNTIFLPLAGMVDGLNSRYYTHTQAGRSLYFTSTSYPSSSSGYWCLRFEDDSQPTVEGVTADDKWSVRLVSSE